MKFCKPTTTDLSLILFVSGWRGRFGGSGISFPGFPLLCTGGELAKGGG